jgi:lysine/arginine/ornithine transport system substrate-binding protein
MKIKHVFVVFAAALATTTAYAADTVVRIGTVLDQAPFEYRDASGKLTGMEIDLGNTMCQRMKVQCRWVTMDFDALIPALKAKKIDAVIAQMSITSERQKSVDFSNVLTLAPVQFVAKKGSTITEDPKTLVGKTIGVQSGSTHETYMRERLPKVSTKVYQTIDEEWLELEAGRVDAVLEDTTAAYDWLSKQGFKNGFDLAGKPINDQEIFGLGTGVAIRKGDAELLGKFNAAIKQVVGDGTFQSASKKLFPFNIAPAQ